MPRSISPEARSAFAEQNYTGSLEALVTITDTGLVNPLLYTTSSKVRLDDETLTYGIVSNGDQFVNALLGAALPPDREDAAISTTIVIDRLFPGIDAVIRALDPETADITLAYVLSDYPDTPIRSYLKLKITNREYGSQSINMAVSDESVAAGTADAAEPVCGKTMSKDNALGLHR